jgi:hypothetical protein
MTLHNIQIKPKDPLNAINRITKLMAINTQWWYILPGETNPRPIQRYNRMWKCALPTYTGTSVKMEVYMDDDFYRLLTDIKLFGAIIYNKINRQ